MYSYFLLKWKFMRLIFFEFQKICVKSSASYLASYFVSMIIINGKNFKIFCIMAHAKKCTYRQNKTKPTKSRRRTPIVIFLKNDNKWFFLETTNMFRYFLDTKIKKKIYFVSYNYGNYNGNNRGVPLSSLFSTMVNLTSKRDKSG